MHISPRVSLDMTVWISYILAPLTLLENSFYQSPSQTPTGERSLQEQHKEEFSWTTVPEESLTYLKGNSDWLWFHRICSVPRRKRPIACARDYRLTGTELLSCKPWKKHFPLLIILICLILGHSYVCCTCLLWTLAKLSSQEDWFCSPSPSLCS